MSGPSLRVIVLAAQRKGAIDPLAMRFGTSHKCLIPLHGRPLVSHVLETLGSHDGVSEIIVSVEPELHSQVHRIASQLQIGAMVNAVEAADNLADSVLAAAQGHDGSIIITTADNALLAPGSIDAMAEGLAHGDVVMAFAQEHSVREAHAEGQRRFYQFRDGGYSNCNLYGIANPRALAAAEIFRGGGQFAKKAKRIVEAFGIMNLILFRTGLLSMESAMRRISSRFGVKIVPVVLPDGSQAIDVDNDRTYRVVEELIEARRGKSAALRSIAAQAA